MSAADLLSCLRALSVIPLALLIAAEQREAAFALFVAAALTDAADGALARRAAATPHGALIDPLADKILVAGVAAALHATGAVPAALLAIIVLRELAMVLIRVGEQRGGAARPADASGKAKTAAQMIALAALVVARPPEALGVAALSLLWVAALFGLVALGTSMPRRERRPL